MAGIRFGRFGRGVVAAVAVVMAVATAVALVRGRVDLGVRLGVIAVGCAGALFWRGED